MKSPVYIFVGHSGAGKGTQIQLLKDKLSGPLGNGAMLYVQTGNAFRALIQKNSTTAQKTRALIDDGKLPPAFLGVHAWAHTIIEEYKEGQIVFIDGTPRIPEEVPLLISMIEFFGWEPHVVHIQVSDDWAFTHMKNRGRADDREDADVRQRIQWFHSSVAPALFELSQHNAVTLHVVNGEQPIEKVHEDVCKELGILD